ncbi:MAG: HAD family phosphatase [Lachnospiraceae bacterium]|nr:HAD family phosphatase [Lachnospiraceae bacterium]
MNRFADDINAPSLDGVKAVFFDLDGSLVDSMWIWGAIDIEYLSQFGLEKPDDLQSKIEGQSVVETARYFQERFNINDPVEVMIDRWNEMAFDKYTNDVFVKEGGVEFLKYCFDKGIKLGVCSSNSKTLLFQVLKKRGIFDYFDIIISGEDVEKGKPDPECYLKAASFVGVRPENCLVFEDLVKGIDAGNAAGMITCAVEDEYSVPQRDEKIKAADHYITDYWCILKNYGIDH